MEFIRQYYFDFGVMVTRQLSPRSSKGFWLTLKLSILGGLFSLIWGLILAVLRQLPGKTLRAVRWLTIAYIDVFRGIPLLLVLAARLGRAGALSARRSARRECRPGLPRRSRPGSASRRPSGTG